MDAEYKEKLKDLVIKLLELVNHEMAGEDQNKYSGIGPVAMIVGAQAVHFHKGYTSKSMDDLYTACESIAKTLLSEWEVDVPDDSIEGPQTYSMPAATKLKN